MKKIKIIGIVFFVLVFLSALSLFVIGSLRPKVAGVYIETNPVSSVWIDGKNMGRTPFRKKLNPGNVSVKLIPDSFEAPLLPYEFKTNLLAGVENVVRYDFADIQEYSAGDLVSFEKNVGKETSLLVISTPETTELTIQGFDKTFTPYMTTSITPGDYQLKFSSQGFRDRMVRVKIHEGYKLTIEVKLSKLREENVLETTINEEIKPKVPMVEILSTPTGYLRVRQTPSSLSDEIGKVVPGKTYKYISTDPQTGWYEIEYETSSDKNLVKKGWVSSQYAKKIEEEFSEASATPSSAVN